VALWGARSAVASIPFRASSFDSSGLRRIDSFYRDVRIDGRAAHRRSCATKSFTFKIDIFKIEGTGVAWRRRGLHFLFYDGRQAGAFCELPGAGGRQVHRVAI
jgi:hypothetical protein